MHAVSRQGIGRQSVGCNVGLIKFCYNNPHDLQNPQNSVVPANAGIQEGDRKIFRLDFCNKMNKYIVQRNDTIPYAEYRTSPTGGRHPTFREVSGATLQIRYICDIM